MNQRIRFVRCHYSLTMEEFGARIGITKGAISLIESGKSNPSDQTLMLISKEFGVSLDWLKTGQGEPFPVSRPAALAARYSFPEICLKALEAFDSLPPDRQAAVLEYARAFIASLQDEDSSEKKARQQLISRAETSSHSPPVGEKMA